MEKQLKSNIANSELGQPKTFENMAYGVRISHNLLVADVEQAPELEHKKKEESCWSLLFSCLMCA